MSDVHDNDKKYLGCHVQIDLYPMFAFSILFKILYNLKVLVFTEFFSTCEHGSHFFRIPPIKLAELFGFRDNCLSVALPFGVQKKRHLKDSVCCA